MLQRTQWFFAMMLPLGLVLGACGGEDPGEIKGTVMTSGGTAIVGASVTTDPATTTATTDSAGRYTIPDVDAGTYKIMVTADGFTPAERSGVKVESGASARADFALEPSVGSIAVALTDACDHDTAFTVTRTGVADEVTGTDGALTLTDLDPGVHTLTFSADGYLAVTQNITVTAGETADAAAEMKCHSLIVAEAARTFLASTKAPTSRQVVITAKTLNDNLTNGDTTDDPVIISVRSSEHYALAHIAGSLDIPWKTVANDASLAQLGEPNSGKSFVDYCYTGHTGGIAAGVLGMLGYPTANLKYGLVSWTKNTTARTALGVEPDYSRTLAIDTVEHTATAAHTPPWLEFTGVTTEQDVVKAAAQAYLAVVVPTIEAQPLFNNINDGDVSNDPFIISVRSPADYATGHIPGAINIPWQDIAAPENLAKIPTDRDIVVYCHTGHTGAIAAGILGTLGYHKVKNLKFGAAAWNYNLVASRWNADNDSEDYSFEGTANTP